MDESGFVDMYIKQNFDENIVPENCWCLQSLLLVRIFSETDGGKTTATKAHHEYRP